jgi:hypothetical protein
MYAHGPSCCANLETLVAAMHPTRQAGKVIERASLLLVWDKRVKKMC